MQRSPPEPTEAAPGLMSMIDVVFLLLIFFICTMSFRVIDGRLEAELPKGVGPNPGEVTELLEPIDLWVLTDPVAAASPETGFETRVRVGHGATYPVHRLPDVLASVRALNPDTHVLIHAGDQVTHGQVVSVVDACIASDLIAITFAGLSGH
jgi:biopolymer transport protein ExbD